MFISWVDEFRELNRGRAAESDDPEVSAWATWFYAWDRPWRGSAQLHPPPWGSWLSDWGLRVFEKHCPDSMCWKMWVASDLMPLLVNERRRAWVFPPTTDYLMPAAWDFAFRRANKARNETLFFDTTRVPIHPRDDTSPEEFLLQSAVVSSGGCSFQDDIDAILDVVDEHRDVPFLRPPFALGHALYGAVTPDFEGWKRMFVAVNAGIVSDVPKKMFAADYVVSVRRIILLTTHRRGSQSVAAFRGLLADALPQALMAKLVFPRMQTYQTWCSWLVAWARLNHVVADATPVRGFKKRKRLAIAVDNRSQHPINVDDNGVNFKEAWRAVYDCLRLLQASTRQHDATDDDQWVTDYIDASWEWFAAIANKKYAQCWLQSRKLIAMRNLL